MYSIKLIQLLNQIVNEDQDEWVQHNKNEVINEWMINRLVVEGKDNTHIPEYDVSRGVVEPRSGKNQLSGEELIYGNYLMYYCLNHDGYDVIEQHEDLNSVEDFILQFHDNTFFEKITFFENGIIKDWKVEGPENTVKIVSSKVIDGITYTKTETTINKNVIWLN